MDDEKEFKELLEDTIILEKFVRRVAAKGIDEIKNERIDRMSRLAMDDDIAEMYIMLFGDTEAMRVAFRIGAAWQREITEAGNKKTERLLGEIDLGE